MKPKAAFPSLAAELQSHILTFLPWRDILHCTSVCKALRQTYISSSELQYIIELGGQGLLPIHNADPDNYTAIATRLRLLRDKAHAWFKFDKRSFKIVSIPDQFRFSTKFVTGGHLCLWKSQVNDGGYESVNFKIFPILPRPSQRKIERDWSQRLARPTLHTHMFDTFMDPAQNLFATASYSPADGHLLSDNESFDINLGTLDGDGIHPQAAGPKLFLSELTGYKNSGFVRQTLNLKGLGRHIALWRSLTIGDVDNVTMFGEIWSLQIWDWQHSMTSNSIVSGATNAHRTSNSASNFCFLGNDRLLIVSNELALYSIEYMSRAPQLLARFEFLSPLSALMVDCRFTIDDAAHGSAWQTQAQQTAWASDPKHRLLCLAMSGQVGSPLRLIFVISTKIFFDLDIFEGMAAPIPWENWGPSNTRVFWYQFPWKVAVTGNRVFLVVPVVLPPPDGASRCRGMKYRIHMMDFSPLAVERRQGLGTVVKEPSTIQAIIFGGNFRTFLPYVGVVSERAYNYNEVIDLLQMWVDEDKIVLLTDGRHSERRLEVIEI